MQTKLASKLAKMVPSEGIQRVEQLTEMYFEAKAIWVADRGALRSRCNGVNRAFGGVKITDIDQDEIDRFAAMSRGKLAHGTIAARIRALRTVLNWGNRHGWIGPVNYFQSPVKASEPKVDWITKEDAKRLVKAAHDIGKPHIALFLHVAFLTAKRRTAILDLTWDRVDFDLGLVDFGEGNSVKKRGTVPMGDNLRKVLEWAREENPETRYVISYNGQRIRRNVQRGIDAVTAHLGMRHVSPHICRHSACTWMAMDGVSMRKIAQYAGMTEAVASKWYAKYDPNYLSDAADALSF